MARSCLGATVIRWVFSEIVAQSTNYPIAKMISRASDFYPSTSIFAWGPWTKTRKNLINFKLIRLLNLSRRKPICLILETGFEGKLVESFIECRSLLCFNGWRFSGRIIWTENNIETLNPVDFVFYLFLILDKAINS